MHSTLMAAYISCKRALLAIDRAPSSCRPSSCATLFGKGAWLATSILALPRAPACQRPLTVCQATATSWPLQPRIRATGL